MTDYSLMGVVRVRGSVLLRRQCTCNKLFTCGFVNVVMFSHNGTNGPESVNAYVSSSLPDGDDGGEVCRLRLHLYYLVNHAYGSCGVGFLPAFVCVCVCFPARYFKNRCSYNHHTCFLRDKCSRMSPENPFILGSKGQRSRVTKTVQAWVFALLWMMAASHCCRWRWHFHRLL